MSVQAIAWALDCSKAPGNERLVMIVMCHHSDDEGFSGCSQATLHDETLLSADTIGRLQQALVTRRELRRVGPDEAPGWWLDIPTNRRPRLFQLVGFLGSEYAAPIRRRAERRAKMKSGSAQGPDRVRVGSDATPSDQAERALIGNRRIEKENAIASNRQDPDPKCPRCLGEGTFQTAVGDASPNGAGPKRVRCPCTFVVDPVLAQADLG